MADDETRRLAAAAEAAAASLAAHLAGTFPDPGSESDYRLAAEFLTRAADSIAGALTQIGTLTGADTAAQSLLRTASVNIEAARSLGQALPQMIGAAEAIATAKAAKVALDTEVAWDRGASDAREKALPRPESGRGRGGDVPRDQVEAAYHLGYAEAGEATKVSAHAPGTGRRYLPGLPVTTVLGKSGVLTGEAGPDGNPRVQFDRGTVATVPRGAITSPVVHVFDDPQAAMFTGEDHPAVANGDVLHAPGPAMTSGSVGSFTSVVSNRDKPTAPGGPGVYVESRRLFNQLTRPVPAGAGWLPTASNRVTAAFPLGPSIQPNAPARPARGTRITDGRLRWRRKSSAAGRRL